MSLVLQATGGALSSKSAGASQTGVDIALAGLGLQVASLVVFTALFLDYMVRYLLRSSAAPGGGLAPRVRVFFAALAVAVVATLARCAYRVDELSQGYGGPLVADEGLFIGLEGVYVPPPPLRVVPGGGYERELATDLLRYLASSSSPSLPSVWATRGLCSRTRKPKRTSRRNPVKSRAAW